jgi:hypothetical protein
MGTKRDWEGQPLELHPKDTSMADTEGPTVLSIFENFRDELDEHHDRRERIIKKSRDITALSKKMYVCFSITSNTTNRIQHIRPPTCPRNQPTPPTQNRPREPSPLRPNPRPLRSRRPRTTGHKQLALPTSTKPRHPRIHRSHLLRPLPPHTDTDLTRRSRRPRPSPNTRHRRRLPIGPIRSNRRDDALRGSITKLRQHSRNQDRRNRDRIQGAHTLTVAG